MKAVFACILLLLFVAAQAQDKLVMNDGKEMLVHITTIEENGDVYFTATDTADTHKYYVNKSKLRSITFSSGNTLVIDKGPLYDDAVSKTDTASVLSPVILFGDKDDRNRPIDRAMNSSAYRTDKSFWRKEIIIPAAIVVGVLGIIAVANGDLISISF